MAESLDRLRPDLVSAASRTGTAASATLAACGAADSVGTVLTSEELCALPVDHATRSTRIATVTILQQPDHIRSSSNCCDVSIAFETHQFGEGRLSP